MKLTLTVTTPGSRQGHVIPVAGPSFTIGRDPECQLRPASDLVSRHHCVLRVSDHEVSVQDLGSRNGTFINGESIEWVMEIRDGDRLRVGPLEFEIGIELATPGPLSDDEVAALLLSTDTSDPTPAIPSGETAPTTPVVPPVVTAATTNNDDASSAAGSLLTTYRRRPR